jgi:hypothetical protein
MSVKGNVKKSTFPKALETALEPANLDSLFIPQFKKI